MPVGAGAPEAIGREASSLHPEYARLQGQMRLLEDATLRLLDPSGAAATKAGMAISFG